ncbi:hypothetical protein A6R71_03975 [Xanthomonas translucens pv. arrhenatheri]|nr:hypothetical protein A6R71_03975 [Xanthomonas translucens pv. arrhenatheri]
MVRGHGTCNSVYWARGRRFHAGRGRSSTAPRAALMPILRRDAARAATVAAWDATLQVAGSVNETVAGN